MIGSLTIRKSKTLPSLPENILIYIFSYLIPKEQKSIALVCKVGLCACIAVLLKEAAEIGAGPR